MSDIEGLKQQAARRAIDFVTSGSVIGLGTGSTSRHALEELSRRLREGQLHSVVGVPTSTHTARLATQLGIPLTTLTESPELDLAIDGADEIDPDLNLIKGQGGALLHEKVVEAAARELIIIADYTKLVPQLGARFPLPVEVIPFAVAVVTRRMLALGGSVTLRRQADGQPFTTDEGNYILDYACGPITDPEALDVTLLRIPGVVDHGLFLGMARRAIVAHKDAIQVIER